MTPLRAAPPPYLPRRYRLTVRAAGAAGNRSTARSAAFRIVR